MLTLQGMSLWWPSLALLNWYLIIYWSYCYPFDIWVQAEERLCYYHCQHIRDTTNLHEARDYFVQGLNEFISLVKETECWHAPVHHFLVLTFDFSVGAGIPWWISEGSRSEVAHVCGQSHGGFVGGGGDRAAAWFWLCKRHATCSPRHLHTFAYMCTCVHGTVTEHMTSSIHVHKISAQEWQDKWCRHYIDGLVQDCSNSIANAHWSYCRLALNHQCIILIYRQGQKRLLISQWSFFSTDPLICAYICTSTSVTSI